ncbi:hypothetical protein TRFO_34678 [Tritrichomonas foetus]|uniref:VIT domain-containing protein n=1 Tax=Tritrichomonas foetus TaxID=1144522 RepID=A0A1J4JKM4_9EUKA|nr:hypothetical protein TRFO_34678 [Tritrichomonas foetus]|eukprot:OHS98951.1 hypothetical protein TRFO_34678 [Tritrichomonas foetus]
MNNRHDLFGVFHGQTHHNDIITIKPKCAEIKGTIKGFIADLKITQTIMNDSGFFIKNLSYDFPTDNNLCIYKIYFIVGQEKIVAQLKEKKIAQKIYKEAKESGITVFRNESHSYGKNKIKLGNIDAQKKCKIIIRCAFEAKLINLNEISFKFPFRKIHSEYKMELDLKICEQQPIKSIFMNGKKINCNCSIFNNNATLKIDNIKSFQDSIFLTIHMKNSIESLLTCSNDTIVVSFIPPPKPLTNEAFINENQEIIFLIDCGFSMRQMISPIKKCLLNCINIGCPEA